MSQRYALPFRFRVLLGGALAAGVLLPLGAGVASAESPASSSASTQCPEVVAAQHVVAQRQAALSEAVAAYKRQKLVVATAQAEYRRVQADDNATAADIEAARLTAQRAVEKQTRLFAAQNAANSPLQEAIRELAEARQECRTRDNPTPEQPTPEHRPGAAALGAPPPRPRTPRSLDSAGAHGGEPAGDHQPADERVPEVGVPVERRPVGGLQRRHRGALRLPGPRHRACRGRGGGRGAGRAVPDRRAGRRVPGRWGGRR